MKITHKDYEKMTKEAQDRHHATIRKELIENGTIKPHITIKPSEENG